MQNAYSHVKRYMQGAYKLVCYRLPIAEMEGGMSGMVEQPAAAGDIQLTAEESERAANWLCNWLDRMALRSVTADEIGRAMERIATAIVAERV